MPHSRPFYVIRPRFRAWDGWEVEDAIDLGEKGSLLGGWLKWGGVPIALGCGAAHNLSVSHSQYRTYGTYVLHPIILYVQYKKERTYCTYRSLPLA